MMVSGEYENELVAFSGTTSLYATEEGECIQVAAVDASAKSANEALRAIARRGGTIVEITQLYQASTHALLVVYRIALPPVQEP